MKNLIPFVFAIITPIIFKALNSEIQTAGIIIAIGIGGIIGLIVKSILTKKK